MNKTPAPPPSSFSSGVAASNAHFSELERYNSGEGVMRPLALEPMDEYPTRTNDSATAPRKRAPDYLDDAAAVYRQRNKVYGDNYRKFGHMMLAMYPDGLTLKTAEDFNRLGVFVQCLAKVSRYAETLPQGGHPDSALDLATYAAMLRELTPDQDA